MGEKQGKKGGIKDFVRSRQRKEDGQVKLERNETKRDADFAE